MHVCWGYVCECLPGDVDMEGMLFITYTMNYAIHQDKSIGIILLSFPFTKALATITPEFIMGEKMYYIFRDWHSHLSATYKNL